MATSHDTILAFVRGGHAIAGPDQAASMAVNASRGLYVISDAAHAADCYAQERVQFAATGTSDYLVPDKDWDANVWYPLFRSQWQATLRSDGTPYPLRTRIGGARSAGAGTVTFALVVTAIVRDPVEEILATGTHVVTATTASATHAWLTGSAILLTVLEPHASDAIQAIEVRDAVGGTNIATEWCWLRCELWAKSTVTSSTPQLSGLHVAEYIGL